jgi:hypothetical protein
MTRRAGHDVPRAIREYADAAVDYVKHAMGIELGYDSETLPVLDHYVRQVPAGQAHARDLVAAAAGAYFGEVVRRILGGSWLVTDHAEPAAWRFELPGGLSFAPVGLVVAAMAQADVDSHDTSLSAPRALGPIVENILGRMSNVSEEVYYSLCGRFDTLEHVQDVLLSAAAQREQAKGRPN